MPDWRHTVSELLLSNPVLYRRIIRKMIIHMRRMGVAGAAELQQRLVGSSLVPPSSESENRPRDWRGGVDEMKLGDEVLRLALSALSESMVQQNIRRWIEEDRSSSLLKILSSIDAPIEEVSNALRQYLKFSEEGLELSPFINTGIICDLIRRFLTDELEYINRAKDFVEIGDFLELLERTIALPGSRGKLGGKAAGVFIAEITLRRATTPDGAKLSVRTPRTWHITSDASMSFIIYNNLEEIIEQKYKEIVQVRAEYDQIVQLFKASRFPPEIEAGLGRALDDFGGKPLVVRSSSLLEDRRESAFSGKYKSLFLANQGSRADRLNALMDAVAEVYASLFGADPLEYRRERGLLDYHEEMGIIIQEVVGTQVGHYYLPSYSGVLFTHNEYRWSPRIRREDGLVRMVAGLGTRAVDRLGDDYPVMFAPGQPQLRVNLTVAEAVRYAPNKIDVINLKTNRFETIPLKGFLKHHGAEIPNFYQLLSLVSEDRLVSPSPIISDFEDEEPIVTFEGLISNTSFVERMIALTRLLKERLATPVDVEFASDGRDFYLLQCRAQVYGEVSEPAQIPLNLSREDIVFSARRFVSNGKISGITHIVYVDPARYAELPDRETMKEVGRAVGALNKALPKRQFILIGPGRWGSRGDIKLGVPVTYSDISNSAMLIEVARKRGNYVPDLSFGTHFFQDLVESQIRYLPLYPDDSGVVFNEHFLSGSENQLSELVPDFGDLESVVRVVDIPRVTGGKTLDVLMNGESDEAVAILVSPDDKTESTGRWQRSGHHDKEISGRWQQEIAELKRELDQARRELEACKAEKRKKHREN